MAILPMRAPLNSVNQIFPSGPLVIPSGSPPREGVRYDVKTPLVDILDTEPLTSVNHRFPSFPFAIPYWNTGYFPFVYAIGKMVNCPVGVMRPMLLLTDPV